MRLPERLDGGDENPKIYSYDLKLLIETYGSFPRTAVARSYASVLNGRISGFLFMEVVLA